MKNRLLSSLLLLALSCTAHAAPQSCTGKILRFLTYTEGNVMILPDWRRDWIYICNLNTVWKGVSPQSCAAWFATVKSAMTLPTRPSTTTTYADAPACSTIPTFSTAPPPDSITMP